MYEQEWEPRGWTYFIQEGEGGPVKIGSTLGDPARRVRHMQTGNSRKLRIVCLLEGVHQEGDYQDRFAAYRIRGEWFDPAILGWEGAAVAEQAVLDYLVNPDSQS